MNVLTGIVIIVFLVIVAMFVEYLVKPAPQEDEMFTPPEPEPDCDLEIKVED